MGLNVIASPQSSDYLIYKGDKVAIYQLILEQYISQYDALNQESLFGLKFREGASTKLLAS